jgi:hypothetical protein
MTGFKFNNRTGKVEFNEVEIVDASIPASDYLTVGGTDGVPFPSGTTAQRPVTPDPGTVRYNTDIDALEAFVGITPDWYNLLTTETGGVSSVIVRVSKEPLSTPFTSIATAIASITDASSSKPYMVQVEPGVYVEPQIILSPYIHLIGVAGEIATTIAAANPAVDLIVAANTSWIEGITVTGAFGVGSRGVYFKSTSASSAGTFRMKDVRFIGNYIDFKVESDLFPSYVITHQLHHVVIDNATLHCTMVQSSATHPARVLSFSTDMIFITGTGLNSALMVTGPHADYNVDALIITSLLANSTGDGVVVQDGATLRSTSTTVNKFENNIRVRNVGAAPTIRMIGSISDGSTTRDLSVEHPGTLGLYVGSSNVAKTFIDSASTMTATYTDATSHTQTIVGSLNIGNTQNTVTNVTDLIQESSAVGVLSGGVISSTVTPLEIQVSAGYGYVGDLSSGKAKRLAWSTFTLLLADNTNFYVFINNAGIGTVDTAPSDEQTTIPLGRVRTLSGTITTLINIPHKSRF